MYLRKPISKALVIACTVFYIALFAKSEKRPDPKWNPLLVKGVVGS